MSESDDTKSLGADEMLRLTTQIVAAYVSNNEVDPCQVPDVIKSVHEALGGLPATNSKHGRNHPEPAVPILKSITPDHIVCLEDGKKLKMLKRYLRTHYDMTPEQYREKWGLPADYPMVAPNYAAQRSEYAKQIGLGQTADKRGKRGSKKPKD